MDFGEESIGQRSDKEYSAAGSPNLMSSKEKRLLATSQR